MQHAKIFVISGPSGVGKGTLIKALFNEIPTLAFSVSATTRKPRSAEIDGTDYYFISNEEFDGLIESNQLLEWAAVHQDRYGTPRKPIEEKLKEGISVILDIDPKGALQVKKNCPEAHLIFILPPSMEELEHRLRQRATENEEAIRCRLSNARLEVSCVSEYDYSLVNDDLNEAISNLVSHIRLQLENQP